MSACCEEVERGGERVNTGTRAGEDVNQKLHHHSRQERGAQDGGLGECLYDYWDMITGKSYRSKVRSRTLKATSSVQSATDHSDCP